MSISLLALAIPLPQGHGPPLTNAITEHQTKLGRLDAGGWRVRLEEAAVNGTCETERANWFAKPGDDTSEETSKTWNRAGPWEARIREECEAVRDHCGVLDLPGFSRFWIQGTGADAWLRGFCTGAIPKIGRMNLI